MNKRPVFGLMVFILMIGVFALPARLVAAKDPGFWHSQNCRPERNSLEMGGIASLPEDNFRR